jgi:DNA invertase Pin-like site-specific DNA recombinase
MGHKYGEMCAKKLNDRDARAVRELVRRGFTQQAIADEYGIARSLVGLIARGKRWKHLWD